MKKLCALRGATQVENTEADIIEQIARLYDELRAKNHLDEGDIVSLIFSVTDDITAKNPAAALRASGRAGETALFSALEPPFAGAPRRIVRVLMHCYCDEDARPHHVYRNGAESLRPDWSSIQTTI